MSTVRAVPFFDRLCSVSHAPRRGPRRSEQSRQAILDGALALCREEGYARLSIEGIASRAGVGKHTIYRWWPSKGAVLIEALDREMTMSAARLPDTGDIAADMRGIIAEVASVQARPEFGIPLAAVLAEAQLDPETGPALHERLLQPRRAPILARLRRAQERGQLAPSLDVEAVVEMLFGALYHRLLLRSGPLDAEYSRVVFEVLFGGAAMPLPAPARGT